MDMGVWLCTMNYEYVLWSMAMMVNCMCSMFMMVWYGLVLRVLL